MNIRAYGSVAVLAVAFGFASGGIANAVDLKIAGQHPMDNIATKVLEETIKEIADANVDLNIKLFPAGQLGSGEQVFGDVAQGVIDMGHTFIYSHNDPILEINSIPYLVGTYEQMRKVYSPGSNFYRVYDEHLAAQGIKLLGVFAEGFIGVGVTKKPDNATTTGPKNVNIRIFSAEVAKLTTDAMGFNSTTVNWSDVVPALQQGIVDGAIGGTAETNLTVLGDAIKYFVPYNTFVENTAFYIGQAKWDSLSAEQQTVMSDAFAKASQKSFELSEKVDKEYMGKLAEHGIEVIALSDDELNAIADHIKAEVWPKLEGKFGKELLEQLKQDTK
ncbi:TRAP transporter substrate-binding protein DctP [Aquamicrobium defluvii]|uniref:TRAP-type C4-dicarboxylate transport system substrate-binding protein n=1 Tax=Aquamicrobium defluvii TaxID=69279 RepID=A0A4R6YF02_9HYPH|nr:TRAP transporter substrate-binding protein DctP [Aquamicrobium defluvii]TDR34830.1 TRAP-type C4-dicarboxylate transport system substrate-binding protein [Aquamicrobium defluvii]